MTTVTETLRRALEQSGQSRYAISKATGIPESTLCRFATGGLPMSGGNIDKLSTHLGLVLTTANTTKAKPGKARKE